jgi:MFS family permease
MVILPALGVFAGWLIVMPNTVLTLALCVDKITGTSGSPAYSLILGAGWLSLILALEFMGRWSDKLFVSTGTRSKLIWFGIVGTLALGAAFMFANSLMACAIIWCALQIPAAAIVSTCLALSAHSGDSPRQGLASGLVGGAPVLSVLVGSLLLTVVTLEPRAMLLATCVAGAVIAIPVALQGHTEGGSQIANSEHSHLLEADDSKPSSRNWRIFLIAAFLLSCSTSATNGYIIAYARNILNLDSTAAASLAAYMVLIAATASIAIGVAIGHYVRKAHRIILTYAFAALVTGFSIVLFIARPSSSVALLSALFFGLGFGAANGLEISIFKLNHKGSTNAGKYLSTFTSVTTAPFVLVPAMAAVLMRDGDTSGINQLWSFGAACAVAAAATVLISLPKKTAKQPI